MIYDTVRDTGVICAFKFYDSCAGVSRVRLILMACKGLDFCPELREVVACQKKLCLLFVLVEFREH